MGNKCMHGVGGEAGVGRARLAMWDFQTNGSKLRLPAGLTELEMEYIVHRLISLPASQRPNSVEVLVGPTLIMNTTTQNVLASFGESLWLHQHARVDKNDTNQKNKNDQTASSLAASITLVDQFFAQLLNSLESLQVTGYLAQHNFSGVIKSFESNAKLKSIRLCEMDLRGPRGRELHDCLTQSWNDIHCIYMEYCLLDMDMLNAFLGREEDGSLLANHLPHLSSVTIVKSGLNDEMFELLLNRLDPVATEDQEDAHSLRKTLELDLHGNQLTTKAISILSNHLLKVGTNNQQSPSRLESILLHSNVALDNMTPGQSEALELYDVIQKHNTSLQDFTWHQCWMKEGRFCPICTNLQTIFFRNNRLSVCHQMKQVVLQPNDDDDAKILSAGRIRKQARPRHGTEYGMYQKALIPRMIALLKDEPSAIYSMVRIRHVVEHIALTASSNPPE